jgi:hypothetical protein
MTLSSVGVVLPWLVTMFCYQASMLIQICNWMALLTIGVVNLVVPLSLYRQVRGLSSPGLSSPTCCVITIGVVNLVVPLSLYRQALLRYPPASATAARAAARPAALPLLTTQQVNGEVVAVLRQPPPPPPLGEEAAQGMVASSSSSAERADVVQAVPDWLGSLFPRGPIQFAELMMVTVASCSVAIIALNIYSITVSERVRACGAMMPGGEAFRGGGPAHAPPCRVRSHRSLAHCPRDGDDDGPGRRRRRLCR